MVSEVFWSTSNQGRLTASELLWCNHLWATDIILLIYAYQSTTPNRGQSNIRTLVAREQIDLIQVVGIYPPFPYNQNGRRVPPNFEVSVSNLEFSQTRYGWLFQRFPPKFSSSKKYSREPFSFPLNIQFFIWSLCRCTSPRCCFKPCSSYYSGYIFQLLPCKN